VVIQPSLDLNVKTIQTLSIQLKYKAIKEVHKVTCKPLASSLIVGKPESSIADPAKGSPELFSKEFHLHHTKEAQSLFESLPDPINQFWISLINETHPLVQLYWLKDLYELVIRWCVALTLAYHRAVSQGDFPEHLRDELGSLIERPTLGQWRYILSRLLEETQIDAYALSALRTTQDRLNDASPAGASYDTSLIALRNLLAHGGGLGPEESSVLLNAHLPKMIAILVSIS